MSRHAFTFLKQIRFLKQNPMLGEIASRKVPDSRRLPSGSRDLSGTNSQG